MSDPKIMKGVDGDAGALDRAFAVTELEESLCGPGGEDRAKDVIARIDASMSQLEGEAARGLQPDVFKRTYAALNALAAAREVVIKRRIASLPGG